MNVVESIDNRLRILHNLITEAYNRDDSSAMYRMLGARNALISLKERMLRANDPEG